MATQYSYLGLVEIEKFTLLLPESGVGTHRRLTTLSRDDNQPPELNELHLSEYEDQVLLVRGVADGNWIWSAEIVEVAGPIMSMLVKHLFGEFVHHHEPIAL
jgi:hypothetical protein